MRKGYTPQPLPCLAVIPPPLRSCAAGSRRPWAPRRRRGRLAESRPAPLLGTALPSLSPGAVPCGTARARRRAPCAASAPSPRIPIRTPPAFAPSRPAEPPGPRGRGPPPRVLPPHLPTLLPPRSLHRTALSLATLARTTCSALARPLAALSFPRHRPGHRPPSSHARIMPTNQASSPARTTTKAAYIYHKRTGLFRIFAIPSEVPAWSLPTQEL